jgi:hypothetical protein
MARHPVTQASRSYRSDTAGAPHRSTPQISRCTSEQPMALRWTPQTHCVGIRYSWYCGWILSNGKHLVCSFLVEAEAIGQVTGLRVSTNNRASTVLDVFLEAIKTYGCPSRMRGDRGGENTLLSVYMIMRKGLNRGSFLFGTYAFCLISFYNCSLLWVARQIIPALNAYGWRSVPSLAAGGKHSSFASSDCTASIRVIPGTFGSCISSF